MPLGRQMVVFRIGREDFALDILRAKEVVKRCEITPIPELLNLWKGYSTSGGSDSEPRP